MKSFAAELVLMIVPLVLGGLLMWGSIRAAKRKYYVETKYNLLFWSGLLLILFGCWKVYGGIFE